MKDEIYPNAPKRRKPSLPSAAKERKKERDAYKTASAKAVKALKRFCKNGLEAAPGNKKSQVFTVCEERRKGIRIILKKHVFRV